MYFPEHFVFRNFRLFLHRCEPHVPPTPLVVPHPLLFPRGGWGTVTWSTQNFSLRLIVLLCG